MNTDSGEGSFKYKEGIYYLALAFAGVMMCGAVISPPGNPLDMVIAALLIGSAIYWSINCRKYFLSLRDNEIIRNSPWPWHKKNDFQISHISTIDIQYQALNFSLVMEDGRELTVPFFLTGTFKLMRHAVDNSEARVGAKAKSLIDYYSKV